MIVKRKPLNLFERLYLPAVIGGFRVTLRHFFKKKVTMQYPEEKWVVPEGYRGAPYLVKDQEGNTKCVSCQLCEFVCPPKAIKIIRNELDVSMALCGINSIREIDRRVIAEV